MERNTELRQTKGITLIALVITIIVLLILAGISIAMLAGDNGLLNKTTLARESTRGGEVQEQVDLAVTENTASQYTGGAKRTRDQVIQSLSNAKKLTPEEVELLKTQDVITIGSINVDFSKLGSVNGLTLVEMYDKAVADNCTNKDGQCKEEDHLHIGDYVKYENPTTGSRTAYATQTGMDTAGNSEITDQVFEASKNQLNWRVLGKENGAIKLIAGRPMKSNNSEGKDPYLYMYGAKAYVNVKEVLDNICNIYLNDYATEARSVNIGDINEITGVTTDEKIKEVDVSGSYGESYGPYEGTHYTPESWLNGKTSVPVQGTQDGYFYIVNLKNGGNIEESKLDAKEVARLATSNKTVKVAESDGGTSTKSVTLANSRIYNMLFDNVEWQKGASYWLASRGVVARPGYAGFGPGAVGVGGGGVGAGSCEVFGSGGFGGGVCFGVRPVVILKSDIKENEVPKIPDKTEERWNITGEDSGGGSGEPS